MKSFVCAAAAVVAVAGSAIAGTISGNATTNNGSGGIFTELTAAGAALNLTSFATFYRSTAGSAVNVEVWTRPGSYAGFTASNAGWTLNGTVAATSAGSTVLSAHHAFTSPIAIGAGQTVSVYMHAITAGGGIRYFGTGTTSVTNFSNPDVALFTNISRTGAIPFGGSQFTPRAFAGEINYDIVPAPASLALISLGGLVAGRRRR